MAMPVRHVKKEKLKVKQETTETTKKVKARGDVIVIDDDPEVVVIDADNGGSDLPAGADDKHGDLPAYVYCGSCETYPESGTCAECGTVYNYFDPFADKFLNTGDLVIEARLLPLDPFIKARTSSM